jgi:hypothetical protein
VTSSLKYALLPAAVTALSASAVALVAINGWTLYYGDAEAHLDIARRMLDSVTPGYDQVGTVWLPLPHWLMLPLVGHDPLWRSGLAGAIPSAVCYVVAALFLFASVRRIFNSDAAAVTAAALFALNPNVLYLQSTPMTEPAFWAALMALLYFSVRGWAAGAGVAACAATLVRYEGWFLLPFAAAYFLFTGGRRRALVFTLLAGLGPLFWLAHNWWLSGHPLDFFDGPYSARAIQRGKPYPGLGNWRLSWLYFGTAARLCAGPALLWIGLAGAAAALVKRAFWPVVLLALPGVFYIWSMHSSGGTPIHVPVLPPFTYYNTRYGLAALPLLALGGAALVALVPLRARCWAAALVVLGASLPWLLHPAPRNWVTWKESQVNSQARLEWTREAAQYLGPQYQQSSGILTSFGDVTGVFRGAGIPLRETFTGDNGIMWMAAVERPCIFVWQDWAVARRGDPVAKALEANQACSHFHLEKSIAVKGEPSVEIYRR